MNKALIKKLDAMPGGAAMSVVVQREGRTLVVIRNGMLLKRAPQPIGLAFEVVARCSHKVSVFIMPHFKATLEPGDGRDCPLLRVCDDPEKVAPVVDPARVYDAAAAAGVENFSQADLAEFVETVKRLAQRGIIAIPKAQKGVALA